MQQVSLSEKTLKIQHAQLEDAIRIEEEQVWKDVQKIEQLKKEKLKKKDELLRISTTGY